jgi:tripartite-type tricarboxylate transporter receptor subunit TctC
MLRSLVALLLAGLASSAVAQDNYPSRQITLIAPFAAGGSTDLVARVVSEGLRAKLGQPVIVENKPGGTGVVGAREVVKADPDGYMLLLANAGATVIPAAMSSNYPIDLNKDLLAIGLMAEFVGVVIAKKELPVNSMQEFIAYAKANPGKLNFGTSGVGSMVHLSAELLMKETGIKMQHLPYKGGSNSMADLLGGTIDALFVSSPVAVGQAENKNMKMLAVTSRYRLQALPNVPTIEESGVPGFNTTGWLGVMGPAALPPTIRQKLSTALVEIARDPETQTKLRKIGFEPIGKDAAAFQEFFRSDVKKWTEFVAERGLKETK